MKAQEVIKTVWPAGNPNISTDRIAACIPKVNQSLEKYGFDVSNHGSYRHLAMEVIALTFPLDSYHSIDEISVII